MSAIGESSAEALAQMRTHFGHQAFRPGQEPIVGAVLGGRDVLAVMMDLALQIAPGAVG